METKLPSPSGQASDLVLLESTNSNKETLEEFLNKVRTLDYLKGYYDVSLEILQRVTCTKHYVKKLKSFMPWSIANTVLFNISKERYFYRGNWVDLAELERMLDNISGLNGCTNVAELRFAMETGMALTDNGLLDRPEFSVCGGEESSTTTIMSSDTDFEEFILENLYIAGLCSKTLNALYLKTSVEKVDSCPEIADLRSTIATLGFVIRREQMVKHWLYGTHIPVLIRLGLSGTEVEDTIRAQVSIYMEKACWIIAKACPSRRGTKCRFD